MSGGQTDVVVQATDYSLNTKTNTYRVTQSGSSRSFSYDANGNLQSKTEGGVTTTYEWDAENRLLAVKQGPTTTLASFTYDGLGRRRTKANSVATATYIWDGQDVVEERSTFFATRRYIHGAGIDLHLAVVENSTPSYFVADHLGSVVRVTNNVGSPIVTREYDPWGTMVQGASVSGYAFTGREWDAEVGLHYYRTRYYDPIVGRFLSPDPLVSNAPPVDGGMLLGQLPLLTDRYDYVRNAPTRYIDPMGLFACAASPPPRPCPDPADIAECVRKRSRDAKQALAWFAGLLALCQGVFVACISMPNPNKPACVNGLIACTAAADLTLAKDLLRIDNAFSDCLRDAQRRCKK